MGSPEEFCIRMLPHTQHSTEWQNFWVFQQPISLSIMLRVPLVILVLLTLQHLSLLHLDRLPRARGHSTRLNLRRQRVKQLAVLGVRNPFSKIRNVLEFNGNSCNVLDGSPIIIIIESAFLMKTILALQLPEDSNKQTKRNEDSTMTPETKLGYEREHQTEIEASKRSLVYSRRKDLRTALYSLRMKLAREQHKQPPCVVFDNAAIDDIVIKLQTNESELIKCRGIGNTRC
jgi:superfamily II DNA helicase RecQ